MASESQPSLGQIAQNLFETALQNILHDTILTQHREHKLMIANLDSTTKLPHCDRCKLPRLLDPPLAPKVRGATSDPPKDTQYCDRKPWSRRPGHDIYDNPFLKADSTGRPPTKKEREAAAKNKKNAADGDGTPVSEEQNQNGTGPPSPSENGEQGSNDPGRKLEKGEKKASKIDEKLKKGEYIPWHTCPSCKRSLLITRFAKHLEQCMGLSGRQASRNAMAKMSSTPSASRAGTPQPANSQDGGGGRGEEDDEDDIAVKGSVSSAAGGGPNMKKKLLKKGLNQKIKKERNSTTATTSSNSHSSSSGKLSKPSSTTGKKPGSANKASSPANGHAAKGGGSGGEKRDRDEMTRDDNDDDDGPADDDDDESVVHVKKRQKLERVGSTASLGSQSTAAGGGMPGLEREESRDGSFVDEGSVGED
ncbi:hypothetical protein KC343_g5852 [Hortaea werneckii]|uniref:SAGA-associated factor 11 n=1 Tax=Hortaea werneckii TaxID=91943 RepID=A0A3M7EMQ6_HORWE|nr:hypothetical protein KC320_g4610 [Hortaea werneckii]KAI7565733.1 hypothetical protein KC317_g6161 [Hortaea werneckii]KAI7617123.1 hypothetical protein KC346_g5649 [Hortaea werneckii]KAI7627927.1 hypothetical protein KC343_g5852 [Hortaea werneckii]KAI7671033.1 hypothetical protein KC319_g5691 [Hortaea werneckii]